VFEYLFKSINNTVNYYPCMFFHDLHFKVVRLNYVTNCEHICGTLTGHMKNIIEINYTQQIVLVSHNY